MTHELHPAALELVGLPFRSGGRDVRRDGAGIDCLGISLAFVHRVGVPASDPWATLSRRHDQTPSPHEWRRAREPKRIGDVVTYAGRGMAHVAPYVGGGYVLHARPRADSVLLPVRRLPPHAEWWTWTGSESHTRSR